MNIWNLIFRQPKAGNQGQPKAGKRLPPNKSTCWGSILARTWWRTAWVLWQKMPPLFYNSYDLKNDRKSRGWGDEIETPLPPHFKLRTILQYERFTVHTI